MAGESHPSRAVIAREQLGQLGRMLAAVVPANLFQTRKLRAAGVISAAGEVPEIKDLAEFSVRVPFTTKAELAAEAAQHQVTRLGNY